MAIFSSITLGRSKGSLGNVTTTRLKGQNVAKAKITSTTNVKSVGQVSSRAQMSNVVMAYQVLALFLSNAIGLRKSTESIFNAFVRLYKSIMAVTVANSGWHALQNFPVGEVSTNGCVNISIAALDEENVVVSLFTNGLIFKASTYIKVLVFKSSTGANQTINHLITEAEWNSGTFNLTHTLDGVEQALAYSYNIGLKKSSTIVSAVA